jgi:hypothetical protein
MPELVGDDVPPDTSRDVQAVAPTAASEACGVQDDEDEVPVGHEGAEDGRQPCIRLRPVLYPASIPRPGVDGVEPRVACHRADKVAIGVIRLGRDTGVCGEEVHPKDVERLRILEVVVPPEGPFHDGRPAIVVEYGLITFLEAVAHDRDISLRAGRARS